MTTLTEQVTLAGLRQQAERLRVPGFAKMRKKELLKAETVLTLLESEFLGALMSGDWSEFDQFVNDFRVEVSTKDLTRPGADSTSQTEPTS